MLTSDGLDGILKGDSGGGVVGGHAHILQSGKECQGVNFHTILG